MIDWAIAEKDWKYGKMQDAVEDEPLYNKKNKWVIPTILFETILLQFLFPFYDHKSNSKHGK